MCPEPTSSVGIASIGKGKTEEKNIPYLPPELWWHVFGFLSTYRELVRVSQVSKTWKQLAETHKKHFKAHKITQISIGAEHSALVIAEQVYIFGNVRAKYKLGNSNGLQGYQCSIPRKVNIPECVKTVMVTNDATFALTTKGKLYVWGNNKNGYLGQIGTAGFSEPRLIQYFNNPVKSIASLGTMIFALTYNGELYFWGKNENQQIIYKPRLFNSVKVKEGSKMIGGERRIIMITDKEKAYTLTREFVDDKVTSSVYRNKNAFAKIRLSELIVDAKIGFISCSRDFVIMLSKNNKVFSFGYSEAGCLGIGEPNKSRYKEPQPVKFPEGTQPIIQIAAGVLYCLALTKDGKVFFWGRYYNAKHEAVERLRPTLVEKLNKHKIVKITVDHESAMAVTSRGEVFAWGVNNKHLGLCTAEKVIEVPQQVTPVWDFELVGYGLNKLLRNAIPDLSKISTLDSKLEKVKEFFMNSNDKSSLMNSVAQYLIPVAIFFKGYCVDPYKKQTFDKMKFNELLDIIINRLNSKTENKAFGNNCNAPQPGSRPRAKTI